MRLLMALTVMVAIVVAGSAGGLAQAAPSTEAIKYPNCKTLNTRWAHGVGRFGARDKTSGTPVTNFRRSNRLYEQNRHLDRDKDKIACEKK